MTIFSEARKMWRALESSHPYDAPCLSSIAMLMLSAEFSSFCREKSLKYTTGEFVNRNSFSIHFEPITLHELVFDQMVLVVFVEGDRFACQMRRHDNWKGDDHPHGEFPMCWYGDVDTARLLNERRFDDALFYAVQGIVTVTRKHFVVGSWLCQLPGCLQAISNTDRKFCDEHGVPCSSPRCRSHRSRNDVFINADNKWCEECSRQRDCPGCGKRISCGDVLVSRTESGYVCPSCSRTCDRCKLEGYRNIDFRKHDKNGREYCFPCHRELNYRAINGSSRRKQLRIANKLMRERVDLYKERWHGW